jgi:hypothetical protein
MIAKRLCFSMNHYLHSDRRIMKMWQHKHRFAKRHILIFFQIQTLSPEMSPQGEAESCAVFGTVFP